jgi:radical SAM protein with 4Fe4S-binding SPASM domain
METLLMPQHIQFIEISEEIVLFFHTESLQIYPLEKLSELYVFLSNIKENGVEKTKLLLTQEQFTEIFDFIEQKILNSPKTTVTDTDNTITDFSTVILPISAKCNLACPYCFAQTEEGFKFGDFSLKQIDNVIDFLVNRQSKNNEKLFITFFGGEPLLNFETIEHTIDVFKNKYPQQKVGYSITTNGTILNKKMISIFKENKFSILISLDGPENEFNLRRFKNGESSLDTVLNNINILRRNELTPQIRATMVSNNQHICQTFDFFEKLQISFNVVFAYVSENKTHGHATYNKDNLKNIKHQLDELLQYYIDKLNKREPIFSQAISNFSSVIRFRIKGKKACSAGVDFFTITANGDIFSCSHLMNKQEYCIGNIFENINKNYNFVVSDIEDMTECNDCWAKYLCKGGCFAQKISMGKTNRSAKLTEECELEKIIWEFYIKLYYYVMKIAPEYFKKEES